ncbi:MAG: polyketide synthase [Rubripirellula sp.]
MPANRPLDPKLTSLLENLRGRVRRYVVWDSALAIAAVILAAFWIGLALDYLPVQLGGTEMPRLARMLLLGVVAASVIAITALMLVGRLRRPLPDDSLALLVERHHPTLGGRLVTAVQLSRPKREGDSHSPALLNHVHREAAAEIDKVDPGKVFRWQPLVRKAMVAGPLAILSLGLLIISPSSFARAASRLTLLSDEPWPRRAHLEMVGVELPIVTAVDGDTSAPKLIEFNDAKTVRLPRGSNPTLRIRADAETSELPIVCIVYYHTDGGTRGQSNMRRVGRITDGYQSFVLDGPPLAGLSESMTLDVRGLDDRLDDFRIEAITPPALTEMKVSVRYADYLRGEGSGDVDLETDYQSGLRISEGSQVTMVATSSEPLGDTEVVLKTVTDMPQPFTLDYSDDRRQLRLTMANFDAATTVSLVPADADGISAQAPYRYFLGVVLDQPPELEMRLSGIGSAVTPIARIPVSATVVDDYGVERLTVSVTPSKGENAEGNEADNEAAASKTASVSPKLSRDGQAKTELDLRDLVADGSLPELVPGGAINVIGEASDLYNLAGKHLTRAEVFRLEVVTPEQLLARLERNELALRSRLEQTIDETRNLRETLNLLRRGFNEDESQLDETEQTRQQQIRRLRTQQSGLQASKTSEELSGIAESLDDILREMVNNRVDSLDRQERIGEGVRDPLRLIVNEPLARLRDQIVDIERSVNDSADAMAKTTASVETADEVIARLTEVLDKMLDLESYNEILDIVRELIEDQDELLKDTKDERKKRVLNLFD